MLHICNVWHQKFSAVCVLLYRVCCEWQINLALLIVVLLLFACFVVSYSTRCLRFWNIFLESTPRRVLTLTSFDVTCVSLWRALIVWYGDASGCETVLSCLRFVSPFFIVQFKQITNQMQQFSSLLSWRLFTAQYVSGIFPPIIRSSMTAVAASGFTFVSWW